VPRCYYNEFGAELELPRQLPRDKKQNEARCSVPRCYYEIGERINTEAASLWQKDKVLCAPL